MYNKDVEIQLRSLFEELKQKTAQIITESRTNSDATERIMRLISSTISAEVDGYVVDMYSNLVKRIKADEYFQNPDNLNAFYRLNLRSDIREKYQFDIENIDVYKKGIEYKEINQIYMSAAAATGTLAAGGILKGILSGVIGIPFAVVIAGALVASCISYFATAAKNRRTYKTAVYKFLDELTSTILDWLVDIEIYFDEKVRTLYK